MLLHGLSEALECPSYTDEVPAPRELTRIPNNASAISTVPLIESPGAGAFVGGSLGAFLGAAMVLALSPGVEIRGRGSEGYTRVAGVYFAGGIVGSSIGAWMASSDAEEGLAAMKGAALGSSLSALVNVVMMALSSTWIPTPGVLAGAAGAEIAKRL